MCPFCLGSAAVFLSYFDITEGLKVDPSNENNSLTPEWVLLAVTRAGKLYVWNLEAKELKYSADMKPLVANCASYSKLGTKTYISSVKLNRVGDPVAVLSNFYSYVYLPKMQVCCRYKWTLHSGSDVPRNACYVYDSVYKVFNLIIARSGRG